MGRRCVAAAAAMVILIHLRRAFVAIPNSLLRSYPTGQKGEGGRSSWFFFCLERSVLRLTLKPFLKDPFLKKAPSTRCPVYCAVYVLTVLVPSLCKGCDYKGKKKEDWNAEEKGEKKNLLRSIKNSDAKKRLGRRRSRRRFDADPPSPRVRIPFLPPSPTIDALSYPPPSPLNN